MNILLKVNTDVTYTRFNGDVVRGRIVKIAKSPHTGAYIRDTATGKIVAAPIDRVVQV